MLFESYLLVRMIVRRLPDGLMYCDGFLLFRDNAEMGEIDRYIRGCSSAAALLPLSKGTS